MTPENDPKIKDFDPNSTGLAGTLFGLPEVKPEDADVVVVTVPWDATTSYRPGTSKAPEAIVKASSQIDFYLPHIEDPTSIKYAVSDQLDHLQELNDETRPKAEQVIHALEEGNEADPKILAEVNAASEEVDKKVKAVCGEFLDQGKTVVLLGGDHSTPLGYMKALAEKYPEFGVLHIDAHADLRVAYEGFTRSHASIMYNATQEIPQITKLVQVGIRDYCQAEVDYAKASKGRIKMFPSESISDDMYNGVVWADIVEEIVSKLPDNVYISFDIDGLKQEYCPATGTPVPGGLEYEHALYLIKKLVESGKKIIGADLNEVGYDPEDEWNEVVGMRLLYRLCTAAACSQGKLKRKNGVRL